MRLLYPPLLVRYVTMMPRLRQALVEFENIEDAINCVTSCQVCVCVYIYIHIHIWVLDLSPLLTVIGLTPLILFITMLYY